MCHAFGRRLKSFNGTPHPLATCMLAPSAVPISSKIWVLMQLKVDDACVASYMTLESRFPFGLCTVETKQKIIRSVIPLGRITLGSEWVGVDAKKTTTTFVTADFNVGFFISESVAVVRPLLALSHATTFCAASDRRTSAGCSNNTLSSRLSTTKKGLHPSW